MAVPAYFAPGPFWKQMDGADRVVKLAVMDPANGPGGSRDPRYARAVRAAKSAGITVVGYVFTDFAHRPLAAVESNIDAYYRWYAVDGVFFDQASTNCANEPYYATLNRYVKGEGGVARTILNPGGETNQCYVHAADILLTFEGSESVYLHSYSAAAWTVRYPASRFWQVIYATPTVSAAARVVQLSQRRRAGFVYVPRAELPNQYDGLPSGAYWADELADIAASADQLEEPAPSAASHSRFLGCGADGPARPRMGCIADLPVPASLPPRRMRPVRARTVGDN